ncbi:hypothetical protein DH2020_013015 [Rehmannia glutinosa]|uniref:Uncharacterized protein n=1 Tax=Rehmannia glutinosa TaxID=99300 RepID=A0ABR0X3K1_REHGL
MSQKRQQQEEGSSFDDKRLRKSHSFRRVVLDVMNLMKLQNLINPVLEPLIRRVVSSLECLLGPALKEKVAATMGIALVDVLTEQVVSSGLESSAKVEIVVLEGDFDGDEVDNWTLEEFSNNIVREREGKKPLLNGDVILTLTDGTGMVGGVTFTDNSSWTRSRKFRLGARLIDDIGGIRIREAKRNPLLSGIIVGNILGTGMSAKKWEITTEHARTCVLDKTLHFYNASASLEKNGGVVFNVVGQVMGMFSNGQYVTSDKLSEAEKDEVPIPSLFQANACELVFSAFGDREKIMHLLTTRCFFPDYAQSRIYPIGGSTSFDFYLHGVDPTDIRYDQPLTFPGQFADNSICDTDSMARAFCELSADLHSANPFIPCPVPVDKAREKGGTFWSVY